MNRRFQAKRAKYRKFHVIETTASISTKFCTTIETIKWLSRMVPISSQQIQDGGRPPFWKKTFKSLCLCNRLTDFDKMVHWRTLASYSGSMVKISNFWKSKMAAAAILKNHKNRDIPVTVWPIFIKFGTLMQNVSLNLSDHSKIRISQIQDGGRPPCWKPLNRHISATGWPILLRFGTVAHIGLLQRIYR